MALLARFVVLAIAACVAAAGPAISQTGARVALVIGNSHYDAVGTLPNPSGDAEAMEAVFRRIGFDVTLLIDGDKREMEEALGRFTVAASEAAQAVIYYAGHGIEIAGRNYLVPTDATLENDTDAAWEAIDLDRVLQTVDGTGVGIVILDACRNNPFASTMRSTLPLNGGLAGIEPHGATFVAYAARHGSVAQDGPEGEHSPFTRALLEHIETPGLDLRFLFGSVRDEVWALSGQSQEPWLYGNFGRDPVYLVPPDATALAPAPASSLEAAFMTAGALDNVVAWQAFLSDYPTGLYADLARTRLTALGGQPSSNDRSVTAGQPIAYTAFDGSLHKLYPWVGRNVALLTESDDFDAATMALLVESADDGYDFYARMVGSRPGLYREYQGRLSIAFVPNTCGAGCGYIGTTGIEIAADLLPNIYEGVLERGEYDQLIFYELGLNFWPFHNQLGALDALFGGFTILGRFLSLEAGGYAGGPFNDLPYDQFRQSILVDLGASYLRSRSLNWENTLAIGAAPANPYGWGAGDLAASLLYMIRTEHGQKGLEDLWRAVAQMPQAGTAEEAISNLVIAARLATGADYRSLFGGSALDIRFDPPSGAPLSIRFANGATLAWTGSQYVEQPGDFRFDIATVSDAAIVLVDRSRDLTWEIPLQPAPGAAWASRWFFSGSYFAAYDVTRIEFP